MRSRALRCSKRLRSPAIKAIYLINTSFSEPAYTLSSPVNDQPSKDPVAPTLEKSGSMPELLKLPKINSNYSRKQVTLTEQDDYHPPDHSLSSNCKSIVPPPISARALNLGGATLVDLLVIVISNVICDM